MVPGDADLRSALPGLRRTLAHLRPHLRRHWPLLTGGFAALFAGVAFRLLEPWPVKWVIDAIVRPAAGIHSDLTLLLVTAGAAVLAFAGGRALSSYLTTVAFALAGSRAMTRVRADVFDHLQRLSLRFHGRARGGDLLTRLVGDVNRLQEVAVTAGLPLVGNVVTLLGMSVVMVVLDPLLAAVVFAAFPVFVASSSRQSRRITVASRRQRRREGELAGTAGEAIGAIRVVQAYGLEPVLGERFARSNGRSLRDGVRTARLSAGLERKTDLLVGVATGVVLCAGGMRVLSGSLTPGELVVFLSYLKSAFKPMRDVAKYTGRIAKAAASGERILDLLDTPVEVADGPDARPAPRLRGEIELVAVTAAYEPHRPALREVHLRVPAGTRLGVVGPSGSGKSTLVSLLLRLQDPVAGRVLIDGTDARRFTLASLRAQVTIVLQESVLFATSVRENIRYGDPAASDTDVERAARLANAHDFVRRLPDGYDTVLGERGATLSGGQRQRIAVARAALRDAPIVVLDEATTALDHANRRQILDALRQLTRSRTTIVVSHDLSAVHDCDLVVWLEDGRIVEQGRPEELLGRRTSRLATLAAVPGPPDSGSGRAALG